MKLYDLVRYGVMTALMEPDDESHVRRLHDLFMENNYVALSSFFALPLLDFDTLTKKWHNTKGTGQWPLYVMHTNYNMVNQTRGHWGHLTVELSRRVTVDINPQMRILPVSWWAIAENEAARFNMEACE